MRIEDVYGYLAYRREDDAYTIYFAFSTGKYSIILGTETPEMVGPEAWAKTEAPEAIEGSYSPEVGTTGEPTFTWN